MCKRSTIELRNYELCLTRSGFKCGNCGDEFYSHALDYVQYNVGFHEYMREIKLSRNELEALEKMLREDN